ncbi:MAG: hypothetical protein EBU67_02730 [Actinobacteria bacterium]|nr:hypothetical protein [Actinomycetota bacterium]NBP53205.1 hypothetical protein [Actinomycetota bacterium]
MTTDKTARFATKRPRHVAHSARILSTGISATAILGMTAAFGGAEKLQASESSATPQKLPGQASGPSGLGPLGTVTRPTGTPATFPSNSAPTTAQPAIRVAPSVTTPMSTVAAIAPAEPPVQFTLPSAPSRGSSGGSH